MPSIYDINTAIDKVYQCTANLDACQEAQNALNWVHNNLPAKIPDGIDFSLRLAYQIPEQIPLLLFAPLRGVQLLANGLNIARFTQVLPNEYHQPTELIFAVANVAAAMRAISRIDHNMPVNLNPRQNFSLALWNVFYIALATLKLSSIANFNPLFEEASVASQPMCEDQRFFFL